MWWIFNWWNFKVNVKWFTFQSKSSKTELNILPSNCTILWRYVSLFDQVPVKIFMNQPWGQKEKGGSCILNLRRVTLSLPKENYVGSDRDQRTFISRWNYIFKHKRSDCLQQITRTHWTRTHWTRTHWTRTHWTRIHWTRTHWTRTHWTRTHWKEHIEHNNWFVAETSTPNWDLVKTQDFNSNRKIYFQIKVIIK